jgi:hypothetical protein
MCHVVACVAKDATTVGSQSSIPVPEDDGVRELPERCCQNSEKCRRHDESVLVHGEVVMDTVEQKVEGNGGAVIGKVAMGC